MSVVKNWRLRLIGTFFALIIAVFGLGIVSNAASSIQGTTHYQNAWDVLDYLNASRKQAGVGSVKLDEYLTEIAMQRAAELSVHYGHTRPNGSSCFTAGSTEYFKAENIAKGQKTAEEVNQAWMNSTSHYSAMINSKYTGVGIGCFEDPNGTLYWVECFGVYRESAIKEEDTNTVSASGKTVKISSIENLSTGIRIKWNKISGVSGYYVYRQSGTGSFAKIATIQKDSKVTYKDTSVKGRTGVTYTYKVIPYTLSDNKTGYGTESSIVRVDRANITSAVSDDYGYVTVKWKKVSGVSGYKVYCSQDPDFASSSYHTVSDPDKKKVTLKNLTKGHTYYIKVCAYITVDGKSYSSAFSRTLSVEVKDKDLAPPRITSIRNSGEGQALVKWETVNGADGYRIYFSTDRKFSETPHYYTVSGNSQSSYTLSFLTKGQKYYIKIRAYENKSGTQHFSDYSSVKSVQIFK